MGNVGLSNRLLYCVYLCPYQREFNSVYRIKSSNWREIFSLHNIMIAEEEKYWCWWFVTNNNELTSEWISWIEFSLKTILLHFKKICVFSEKKFIRSFSCWNQNTLCWNIEIKWFKIESLIGLGRRRHKHFGVLFPKRSFQKYYASQNWLFILYLWLKTKFWWPNS